MYSKERIVEILPDLEEPLNRIQDILKKESPFSEIKELNSLLHEINESYQKLVSKKKEEGLNRINKYLKDVEKEIPSKIEGDIQRQILFPLISLLKSIESTETWTEVNSSYSLIEDSYTKSLNQLNNITKAIISTEKAQKTIKPVKINELVHRDKGLETEKDVDEYVGELRYKLKDEIKKGNTIKIL
jgi:hypothetical protein